MATFRSYEDIEAWQKARVLCRKIYLLSKNTDLHKDYRLKDQVNASCGSIMDNIAEGFGLVKYLKSSPLTGVKFKKTNKLP